MVGLKNILKEVKCSDIYYKKIMLERIFSGIGIVFFICSLSGFSVQTLIKILIGIILGIFIIFKNHENEKLKEALMANGIRDEVVKELSKQKNKKIKLWVNGSKNMNKLILAVVSLGMVMVNLSSDVKKEEKITAIKDFLEEINNFYELNPETKVKLENIFQSNPDILEVMKELRDLELSNWVQNEITDFLWKIIFANGYMGIEEEKLLDSWKLYLKREDI